MRDRASSSGRTIERPVSWAQVRRPITGTARQSLPRAATSFVAFKGQGRARQQIIARAHASLPAAAKLPWPQASARSRLSPDDGIREAPRAPYARKAAADCHTPHEQGRRTESSGRSSEPDAPARQRRPHGAREDPRCSAGQSPLACRHDRAGPFGLPVAQLDKPPALTRLMLGEGIRHQTVDTDSLTPFTSCQAGILEIKQIDVVRRGGFGTGVARARDQVGPTRRLVSVVLTCRWKR